MLSLQLRQQRSARASKLTVDHGIKTFGFARPRLCPTRRGATKQALAPTEREGVSYDALWDAFANKVQGEWEGVTVTFNAEGSVQPLPERFVPGAYREWGVELYDWQSQSSCLVTQGPGTVRSLRNIFKRLMPTVGCEADAIAYVEEAEDVWKADGGSPVKPVTPSGGYIAAPAKLAGKAKVEVCLAAPASQTRLRATLTLMQHWESKQWQVTFVDLSRETYDGPFNGGVELSGCAGGGKPFAKEPVTSSEQLSGHWTATDVYRYSKSSDTTGRLELQLATEQGSAASVASVEGSTTILLPLGAWVSCAAAGSEVRIVVGALRGDSERDIAVCSFVEGCISELVLATEVKQV
ncbi:hypothetical protein Vretimale_5059 [Volvox reticuliferus]|uniref:Uncharacterized protein n=1 Tax=Volvox reticuliferus TaxID=1737510 RepID=A0A8J4DHK8_9CHLO|nr:hypothetical protein Vretifemale_4083 [Volvox reticuliferus]GIL99993.1 hypothetical protein Vretimale_5059 [Volvox reticuliferus]